MHKLYQVQEYLPALPSVTPFGLTLGSTNPGTILVAPETLDFRRGGLPPPFLLLVPTFSLPNTPQALAGPASTLLGMLLYQYISPEENIVRKFGILLSPGTFSARILLTSELLRYL